MGDVQKAKEVVNAVRSFGERSRNLTILSSEQNEQNDRARDKSSILSTFHTKSRMLEIASRQPLVVGVFVDQSNEFIRRMVEEVGLDLVQLHGQEGMEAADHTNFGVPAIRHVPIPHEGPNTPPDAIISSLTSHPIAILLDTTVKSGTSGGGTGKTFDWNIVEKIQSRGLPVIIAGG